MKNKIAFISLIVVITLVLVFLGNKVIHATGKYPFCGSCHSWDGPIAITNVNDDIHGAKNPKGVVINCADCHLPHDNLAKYLFTKAKNGVAEGFTTLTKDPTKKDWLANREHARKNYTFDSSCLKCHENAFVKDNEGTLPIHLTYLSFKGSADEMKCTDCHKHIGHKDLAKTLYDLKDTTPHSWEEWEQKRAKNLK